MPRSRLTHLLILLSIAAWAIPALASEPRLARVWLTGNLTVSNLVDAGLDVTWSKGDEVRFLERPRDAERLRAMGLAAEILDEQPGRSLARRTRLELESRPTLPARAVRSAVESDGVFRTHSLPPFGSGSMGGFWTAAEIKMKLDALVSDDANDLVADKIDTLGNSRRGKPVWGLAIGKAVQGVDTRPVVFMNALTHAREPEGMQALFYFVDDLISRYGVDPFATYLLEKRRLYIVPLVNPDGYAMNESTYFGSGGFNFGYWRKNTRDNNGNGIVEGDSDGVDLNRNFSFQWGLGGASTNPWDETYRGPSAASEPETQIQRSIVSALHPVSGLSFHTFSDLMLFPWGYTTTAPLDVASFKEWSDELTRDNAYISGQAPNVLYSVSGEFNDWCYGDTTAKPRMYSWTPEVGDDNDDFWPPPSRIVPLAQENLRACYVVTAIAGPYVKENGWSIAETNMNRGNLAHLSVRARNLGITGTAGPGLTGTLTALSTGVHVLRAVVDYPTLGSRQNGDPALPFQVAVDDTVTVGRLLRFQVDFAATDGFFSRDTIAIPCGTPTVIASDNASGTMTTNWMLTGSPGAWGIVSNDSNHPSRYFADSPLGAYGQNSTVTMRWTANLNLSTVVHAYAFYESRWEMEPDYDGCFVEASPNGVTYTPVASTGTTRGSGLGLQTAGLPIFAGSRQLWQPEMVDLSPFTGAGKTTVRLRFRFASDGGNPNGMLFDGMNVDSFRVLIYDPAAQPAPVAVGDGVVPGALEFAAPSPNPARGFARFGFALPRASHARLEILDVQGRRVRLLADSDLTAGRYVHGWDLRDESNRAVAPGVYLARFRSGAESLTRRLVVTR